MKLRKEVSIFATEMEARMKKEDPGRKSSFKNMYRWELFGKLQDHKEMLGTALHPNGSQAWNFKKALEQSAHVANYAMMLHWQARVALDPELAKEEAEERELEKEIAEEEQSKKSKSGK